jgi:hypothetical protein
MLVSVSVVEDSTLFRLVCPSAVAASLSVGGEGSSRMMLLSWQLMSVDKDKVVCLFWLRSKIVKNKL